MLRDEEHGEPESFPKAVCNADDGVLARPDSLRSVSGASHEPAAPAAQLTAAKHAFFVGGGADNFFGTS
jgi:hypothetical protein